MSKFNILWIDDHWNEKEHPLQFGLLNETRDAIQSKNKNVVFTVKDSIAEGVVAFFLRKEFNFNLLILDLMFENDNNTVELVIENAERKILPVIIFSNNISKYDKKIYNININSLILGAYEKGNKNKFIEAVVGFSKFKPLNIAHISDIHYNSGLTGASNREQTMCFESLRDLLSKESTVKPFDLIFLTGDFASIRQKEDFDEIFLIIQDIVNQTIKDFSRLCVIPGNHDIYWDNFKERQVSSVPAKYYYHFLERLYSRNFEIISSLVGYNLHTRTFDEHFDPDSFCWSKRFQDLNIEVLGLNTVCTSPELQGLGKISEKTVSFIRNQWKTQADSTIITSDINTVRIALLHHNILPPFSINTLDESKNILNAGEIVDLLARLKCNLILSGHCHDSYVYNLSYSILNNKGFSSNRNISYISTGTIGGYTSTGDRAKSFNIINIFASNNSIQKNVLVTPYLYDSKDRNWIGMKPLSSVIQHE